MTNKETLSHALEVLAARAPDRFTVPGHKGVLCARDFTELGVNEEIFPSSLVAEAQKETARLYGVHSLFYLTNGSSMGIKAALYRFRGQEVLFADGAHRAFTEACTLWNIRKIPIGGGQDGYAHAADAAAIPPLTLKEAERAVKAHPKARALFLTSPDYMGRCADLAIADLCKEKGVALIADAAHGAHFAFADGLQDYRFETKAALCNMSAHKTLAAYTQGAYLAASAEEEENAKEALRLLGTTSPNYVLLASLSDAAERAATQGDDYKRLRAFSRRMHDAFDCLPNVDYTRLCVKLGDRRGREAYAYCTDANILPETVIGDYTVFVLTPQDDDEKLDRLYRAVRAAQNHTAR